MSQYPNHSPDGQSGPPSQEMATNERDRCDLAAMDGKPCYTVHRHDVWVYIPTVPEVGRRRGCFTHALAFGQLYKEAAFHPIEPGSAIVVYRAAAPARRAIGGSRSVGNSQSRFR